jgi:CoA:oxalate CoA-transferase
MAEKVGPLNGVTVVDFTRMLAGPFCSATLADLGAEIIKIEPPHGDDQRGIGAMKDGLSVSFELLNRNKRSLRLDLKQEEGRRLALQLAAKADVVLENFRPGVADKLGVGYEAVRALRPDTIYCSISGFGQIGPMASAPSYDVVAQALSGLMSITGRPDGDPTLVGDSIGDILAGIYAAMAIPVALYRRQTSGQGSRIDVAMFDSLFSLLPTALAKWQVTGLSPERVGNRHPLTAPFGAFMAADGPFMLAVANDKLFSTLASAMGQPELAQDPRFATDPARFVNRDALTMVIETWAAQLTTHEVVAQLTRFGLPASTVWTVEQAANSEQVASRNLISAVEHPVLGPLSLPEQPVHLSGSMRGQQKRAPHLGEDGAAILAESLGCTTEEIAVLRSSGVI